MGTLLEHIYCSNMEIAYRVLYFNICIIYFKRVIWYNLGQNIFPINLS